MVSGTVGKDIERRNRAVFRNKIDGTGEVFLDHCLKAPEICRIDSGSIFRCKRKKIFRRQVPGRGHHVCDDRADLSFPFRFYDQGEDDREIKAGDPGKRI